MQRPHSLVPPAPHGVLFAAGVPWQTPLAQVSLAVQGLPSLHDPPLSGTPAQMPAAQVSGPVHTLLSSHDPPLLGVPVHMPFAHMSGLVHSRESSHSCASTGAALHINTATAALRNCRICLMIPPLPRK
jgi:hypothetical protein